MRIPISLSIAISSLLLTACGADSNKDLPPVDYSHLQLSQNTESPLVLADESRLSEHLKNGLRLQLGGQFFDESVDFAAPPAAAPPVAEAGNDGGTRAADGAGFSDTNVHVAGVDEADYAKYDGQHWYIATYPQYHRYLTQPIAPGVQIAATDPATPNVEIVGQFQMDEDWGSISEMYLVQQEGNTSHLAALRNQWGSVMPVLPGGGMLRDGAVSEGGGAAASRSTDFGVQSSPAVDSGYWLGPVNSSVRLQLINVQDPSDPQQDWDLRIDGALIDSRKIGNTLYLITRFDPWLAGLDYAYWDDAKKQTNEARIRDSEIDQLLPKYRIADGSVQALTTNCYLQENVQDHHGYASLVHITAIDLSKQTIINSSCLNSGVESLSMSTESLYLTGTVYDHSSYQQKTVIHKFDLTENGAEYAATGSVSGGLGWRSDPAFRLHEYQDDLRVVTSQWHSGDIEHKLFILEQDGNRLRPVAELPNEANPAPIGKPGEDIYSVRFQGDRAYIVTFLMYDPLYSIDLSDRLNPRVTGELEVPGFATYMHPIGNDYLFTLGNDARDDGMPLGIKAELIDISGDTPTVVDTIIFGDRGTQSEATYNLKAMSFLPVGDDELRIVLPISVFEGTSERSWGEWQYTGLQLLEIQGLAEAGQARMSAAGTIVAERGSSNTYPSHGIHRGILHDNAVFYTHNNAIWAAHWQDPDNAVGPITANPIACTTEYVYGLQVQLYLASETDLELNACDALVTATDGDYQEVLMPLEPYDDSESGCQFYGAGERPGSYVVESSFPGFTSNARKVHVGADICHVIPEHITVQLYEEGTVACSDVLTPSLVVDLLLADRGASACDAEVVAVQDGQRYPLQAMVPPPSDDSDAADGHCQFSGPHELPGHMALEVNLSGYTAQQVDNIFVPHEVCHVSTQHLRLELAPL